MCRWLEFEYSYNNRENRIIPFLTIRLALEIWMSPHICHLKENESKNKKPLNADDRGYNINMLNETGLFYSNA
jgi:hypothetical protein